VSRHCRGFHHRHTQQSGKTRYIHAGAAVASQVGHVQRQHQRQPGTAQGKSQAQVTA